MLQMETDASLARCLQELLAVFGYRRKPGMFWREGGKCEHCGAECSSEEEVLTHLCLNCIDWNSMAVNPLN